jgi:hypothetical protein
MFCLTADAVDDLRLRHYHRSGHQRRGHAPAGEGQHLDESERRHPVPDRQDR